MVPKIIMGAAIMLGTFCTNAHPVEYIEVSTEIISTNLKDKFYAGDYWSVGSDGMDFLNTDPGNDEIRMIVADSLAWTGRYAEAITQYQKLAGTTLSDNAALGMANAYRWSGRPELAGLLYRQILTSRPDNPDAVDGLDRIDRELRPRTEITLGNKSDSNSVIQNSIEFNHYWRGEDAALKYELSLNASRYMHSSVDTHQREINLRFKHSDMALAPTLDLSVQQEPVSKAFAKLRLKLINSPELHVTFGHVNWGYMAFQPQALLDGLDATQLGMDGSLLTRPGSISLVYNEYQVSDGNWLNESNLRFSPSWRPSGSEFRYYIGLSGRYASRNTPSYWSPDTGYLSTDIGFTNEWSLNGADYSIYAQRGFHASGEALNSYNMGFAAKQHIGHDWLASLSAGLLENQRADAYHSKYLTLGVEMLW